MNINRRTMVRLLILYAVGLLYIVQLKKLELEEVTEKLLLNQEDKGIIATRKWAEDTILEKKRLELNILPW